MKDAEQLWQSSVSELASEPSIEATLDSTAHLRSVAALSDLGTLRIDLVRREVLLDAAAATQHGLSSASAQGMALESWLSLFPRADCARMHALVTSALQPDRTDSLRVGVPWSTADASSTLEFSFRVDLDSGHVVGACKDVTAVEKLEEARQLRTAAERASQAKSEFMSQVSHELRTPLNAILGFTQLMAMDLDEPPSSKQHQRLQVLYQSGLRLLALVDQLLQIGKIEQGKLDLHPRAVNVYALARRCVDSLTPMAAEKDVSIEIDIPSADIASVRADEHALEQVLTNLLSNGIKYNRRGGRVSLRYRMLEAGEITVADTGPGLTPTQISRLFEPFNRLGAARSDVPGTGLGLVISRQLVEAMGGRLQVWSEVGVGSRFRIELARARGTRARENPTLPIDMPSQWAHGEMFRVLYIEDDDVNVMLVEQLFATQPDWSLGIATNGASGIAEAVRQRPDLILLDLNLPDMDGRDVLKRLRLDRRTRDIPVVAVSADAMPAHLRRSRSQGFEDYWIKPLNLSETVAKLKSLFLQLGRTL